VAKRAVIAGAGLAGSLLALYLARAGWQVDLRERRGDPRSRNFVQGRSINLAISARGIKALRRAGLESHILRDAIRMPGRMIHSRSGALTFQRYSSNRDHAILSISRSALNLVLLNAAAAEPSVSISFDQRCSDLDGERGRATFTNTTSGVEAQVEADLIVGADGAYSTVRGAMQRREGFDFEQSWLGHGYKEMTIAPVASGPHAPFAMEPRALHIWPRGSSMMIALPNPDGSFTCTLFWPHTSGDDAQDGFDAIGDPVAGRRHFEREYPDALSIMPTFDADFAANPVGWMLTIRCRPWSSGGRAVLVGDAAHAIVPFFGQGANASFEDCEALVDSLERHPTDVAAAIREYEQARKPNADAIAEMALQNFIEMRDRTASRLFLARKSIEHLLHRIVPAFFTPRYDMVSFDTIPYAEALAKSQRQDAVLTAIALAALGAIVAGAVLIVRAFVAVPL
jgi:kynurenine 3-monooxygenase